ncbi:MAG: nucleoside hydrolase [Prevotellaceae bacterium]|jgi:inosine-uridine nucleoside N-ribohydrolase|nr:nucleoside hydrolase [Prevotellaceae bacterium]
MKKYILIIVVFASMLPDLKAQTAGALFSEKVVRPRMRVIIDNDLAGDPDGLFHLAQQLLSPSAEVRGIIGSHFTFDPAAPDKANSATLSAAKAKELLAVMHLTDKYPVYEGSNRPLKDAKTPQITEAAQFIVSEAMRTDTKLPLYVVCGASLTNIASAFLIEPAIADKITLVWIGGQEHEGLALPPPNHTAVEYNLNLCIHSAQVIFNRSGIMLWQVPRNAYRQCQYSYAELLTKIKPKGALGLFLTESLEKIMTMFARFGNMGETYILGDSPLVLLTALQSNFEPDPSSSIYVKIPAPSIDEKGLYHDNPDGRPVRVYTHIDTRMMFEDMDAKISMWNYEL